MSEKGLCADCGSKTDRFCLPDPCRHEVCQTCLERKTDLEVCSHCNGNVESLSCPRESLGCPVSVAPGAWKDHVGKCLFIPVKCPYGCEAWIQKRLLLSHMEKDCPLRVATCKHCGEAVYEVEVASHTESCPEVPVTCPYCLQEGIKMKELPRHEEGCPKTPKPCPLQGFGCVFSGADEEMNEHLVLKVHVVCFEALTNELRESQDHVAQLRDELIACKAQLDEYKTEMDVCKLELCMVKCLLP